MSDSKKRDRSANGRSPSQNHHDSKSPFPRPLRAITSQNLTARLKTSVSLAELHRHANEYQTMMSAVQDATICVVCGRFGSADERLKKECREFYTLAANMWLSRPLNTFGREARGAANILHAGAKLGLNLNYEIIQKLFDEALRLASGFEPRGAANTLWAAASMGVKDPRIVNGLARACVDRAKDLNTQVASNSIWAIAKMGVCDASVISALAKTCVDQVSDFSPQNAANAVWAIATLGVTDGAIIAALSGGCVKHIDTFNVQEATNALWAIATLHISDDYVIRAIAQSCVDRIRIFSPQDAAISMWAVATLGVTDAHITSALAMACVDRVRDFNPQDAANSLWAIATLGFSDIGVIKALVGACYDRIHRFNAQDAGNSLWSVAKLGITDNHIISALVGSCIEHMANLKPKLVANCLWAIAILGVNDDIKTALTRASLGHIEKFNPQNASNALWSAAVLNITDTAVTLPLTSIISDQYRSIIRVSDAQQCLQAHYAGLTISDDAVRHFHAITLALRDPANTSIQQISVSSVLTRLGFAPRLEVPIFNGIVKTDIVVVIPSSDGSGRNIKVSIEFDGPWHYLRPAFGSTDRVGQLDGQTRLRNSLLKKCGEFDVLVMIPFFEWDEVKGDSKKEEEYVKRKLVEGEKSLTPK